MNNRWVRVGVATLVTILASAPSSAQEASTGAVVQSYRFDDPSAPRLQRVQLLTVPFAGAVVLPGEIGLLVRGAYAEGHLEYDRGGDVTISGPIDARLAVSVPWKSVRLTAGGIIPTGKATLTANEANLVGVLSTELLPFSITHWGSGGGMWADLDVTGELARSYVTLRAGYGSGYRFEPLAGDGGLYAPGPRVNVRLTGVTRLGDLTSWTWILGGQRHFSDVYLGEDLYTSGLRLMAHTSLSLPIGAREGLTAYLGIDQRGAGTSLIPGPADDDPFPERRLRGVVDSRSRLLLRVGAETLLTRGRSALLPAAEIRVLRTEDGLGQGWLATVGVSADRTLLGRRSGPRLIVSPAVRAKRGTLVAGEGARSGIGGWEVSLGARWEGR